MTKNQGRSNRQYPFRIVINEDGARELSSGPTAFYWGQRSST